MRPWMLLLLLSLLVSDLSPLRDRLTENWTLCRKVPLSGLKILPSCSVHKLNTSLFYQELCDGQRGRLPEQKFKEIILRNQTSALVVSLPCAKRESISTLTDQHAADESRRISMRLIKAFPYLRHRSAASGSGFEAFPLEKSKDWEPATSVWLQKVLTKRYGAAETVVISCCFKESEAKGVPSIKKTSKNQSVKGQMRETESRKQAMGSKVLKEHDGQPNSKGFLNRYDTFKAAALYPSEGTRLQKQSEAGRVMKKRERLSFLLRSGVQRQQSLKASSVYDDDDDGFYIKRKLLLAPREKPESINNPRYKIKVAPDDNKEKFSRKIIAKQAKLQSPQGESAAERSHKNIENGNQERLTYRLQAGFTHKTDNNDDREMLSEVGDDILIRSFLPDTKQATQTERKLILDADVKLETVNKAIKELDDPPPKARNFITEAQNSECKHLGGILLLLQMYAVRKEIKADKDTTESAVTEKGVRGTAGRIEQTETTKAQSNNTSINHRKQETSVEPGVPSPPSITMRELETEPREINTETTSRHFNQRSPDRPQSTTTIHQDFNTNVQTRFITRRPQINVETTAEKSHSGLRMREGFLFKLHRGKKATMRRPEREREEREGNESEDRIRTTQTQTTTATQTPLRKHVDMPPCRGLVHRTEAGWRHCVGRYLGAGSEMFSSGEPTDGAFKDTGEKRTDDAFIREHADSDDDEYDHFYYLDGVMKRVGNNLPPVQRQRLRRRRSDNTETNAFSEEDKGESQQNLFSHI